MIKHIRKDGSDNPDVTLLQALKEGDRTAYGRLLGKYYNMVFLILSGLDETGNREAVKKASADLFLEVWESRADIATDRSMKETLFDLIYKHFKG